MVKRPILIFIVILAIVLGTEVLLPKILSNAVAQGMTTLTGSKEVSAKLEKSPAILMLAGKFDRVTLDAANARVDKIVLNSMHIVLDNVELDQKTLLYGQKAVIKNIGNVELKASITEEELADYINTSVKGMKDAAVNIEQGKVSVSSRWTVGGLAKLDIKIQGKITSTQQKVKFIPEQFFINDSLMANNRKISGMTFAEISLLDSSKLPFGVVFRNVEVQDGKITITADNIPH